MWKSSEDASALARRTRRVRHPLRAVITPHPSGGGQRTARPTINLPTQFERDTLLTPLWVAESVVQEVERFLKADLPENFAERLAAKAYHLYPRTSISTRA